MAEITRTRDHDPYGDMEYCIEWTDNDGIGRERYFKSRRAAEKFAVEIEAELLTEAVQVFNDTIASLTPAEEKAFTTRISRQ